MTWPIALGCLWLIAANLAAMLPSRDRHWRAAFVLIALGLPLLVWIALVAGPLWALPFVLGGASLLRWPLVRLWRWFRR